MNRLGTAGVLWVIAALFGIAAAAVFRDDATQWVVTIALGIVAGLLGALLIRRPNSARIPWSNIVGIVWLVLYAALAVLQVDDVAAMVTDVAIGAIGVVAAALAYLAVRKEGGGATS